MRLHQRLNVYCMMETHANSTVNSRPGKFICVHLYTMLLFQNAGIFSSIVLLSEIQTLNSYKIKKNKYLNVSDAMLEIGSKFN